MSKIEDFDRKVQAFQDELDELWTAYQQACPEEKPILRKRYLGVLRQFSAYVNPH
jgi:hypothetical protein